MEAKTFKLSDCVRNDLLTLGIENDVVSIEGVEFLFREACIKLTNTSPADNSGTVDKLTGIIYCYYNLSGCYLVFIHEHWFQVMFTLRLLRSSGLLAFILVCLHSCWLPHRMELLRMNWRKRRHVWGGQKNRLPGVPRFTEKT